MKFNYEVLKSLDMVVCAGRSPFATLTRWVTSGFKNCFNHEIAVHTGIIFDLGGQKLIAEMQPKGLELNSLEGYSKIGGRRWVIGIRRHPALDNKEASETIQAKIALDLRRRLEYDYKGLFEFVSKRVKDNKRRAYCSEYYYQLTRKTDLNKFVEYPKAFEEKVSPFDLQACAGFYSVAGWKL